MAIKIIDLSTLSSPKISEFSNIIATWYYTMWGSKANLSQKDFLAEITTKLSEKTAQYFIAIDTSSNELVGTIGLSKKRMEDDERYSNLGPWISGFYINEDYRKQKIGTLLGRKVASVAIENNIENLYYFTHHLDLMEFYNRFGAKQLKPLSFDKPYQYKGKDILLFKVEPKTMLKTIDSYIENSKSMSDKEKEQFEFTPQKTAVEVSTEFKI